MGTNCFWRKCLFHTAQKVRKQGLLIPLLANLLRHVTQVVVTLGRFKAVRTSLA